VPVRKFIATTCERNGAEFLMKTFGSAIDDNFRGEGCRIVVLAVKPKNGRVLAGFKPAMSKRKLVIRFAAGVNERRDRTRTGGRDRVIRMMPNTLHWLLRGAAAWQGRGDRRRSGDGGINPRPVGICVRIEENSSTGDAAQRSGPAYVYERVEAMINEGSPRVGKALAKKLATQTATGGKLWWKAERTRVVARQGDFTGGRPKPR